MRALATRRPRAGYRTLYRREPQARLSPPPRGRALAACEAPQATSGVEARTTAGRHSTWRAMGDGFRVRLHERRTSIPDPDAHRHIRAASAWRGHRAQHQRSAGRALPRRGRGEAWLPEDDHRRQRPRVHLECARPVGARPRCHSPLQSPREACRQRLHREFQRTPARGVSTRTGLTAWTRRATSSTAARRLQRTTATQLSCRIHAGSTREASSDIGGGMENGGTSATKLKRQGSIEPDLSTIYAICTVSCASTENDQPTDLTRLSPLL